MKAQHFARIVAAIVLPGIWGGTAAQQSDTAITFRFAPPAGTEYIETLTTTRIRTIEGSGSRVDRSETRTLHSIRKHDDEYLITSKLIFSELTRDGEPQADLVSKLMNSLNVVYRVGPDGQVREISGYGELMKQVGSSMPPDVVRALAPVLAEKSIVARETAEWNGRIGFFAGLAPRIGQVMSGDTPYTLPNGESIRYTVRTAFPRMEPCRAGLCVRIEINYDSDAAALDKLVPGEVLAEGAQGAVPSFAGGRISGSTSRLIDPQTMLIYDETSERTITMNVTLPGGASVPAMQKETRQHSFAYR